MVCHTETERADIGPGINCSPPSKGCSHAWEDNRKRKSVFNFRINNSVTECSDDGMVLFQICVVQQNLSEGHPQSQLGYTGLLCEKKWLKKIFICWSSSKVSRIALIYIYWGSGLLLTNSKHCWNSPVLWAVITNRNLSCSLMLCRGQRLGFQ